MIIRILKRENPYVQIDKRPLSDTRLSWKAKGILAYLLSKPDSWCVRVTDLANQGPDGPEAIRTGLNELRQAGYAELRQIRGEKGVMAGSEWVILEEPQMKPAEIAETAMSEDSPRLRFSESRENPSLGKTRVSGNRHLSKNGLLKEKEMIEKKSAALPPPLMALSGFEALWKDFGEHRKKLRKPMTAAAETIILRKLAARPERAIAALECCMEKGWQSFEWDWLDNQRGSRYSLSPSPQPTPITHANALAG